MLKSIDVFSTFRTKFTFQYFSHFLVSFIVLFVFSFVYLLCICPIQEKQFHAIAQLAQSAQYPQTQRLAKHLLAKQDLTQWQYFLVVRAYQYEKIKITRYPALAPDDTPPRF
ncbi:hypothetical protein [Acinetobacter sp. MB5]|uniref:hypothetical protein n=1 Tax=Acinetobacter sp. MB5 TaxID=2069438 RepID=UPI000DD04FDA|nr:hypothetical protein [Acinetobacter sp. MB5]